MRRPTSGTLPAPPPRATILAMDGDDLADDTYLAVPPAVVAPAVHDPARWRLWWPDLRLVVDQDRAVEGVRWRVERRPARYGGDLARAGRRRHGRALLPAGRPQRPRPGRPGAALEAVRARAQGRAGGRPGPGHAGASPQDERPDPPIRARGRIRGCSPSRAGADRRGLRGAPSPRTTPRSTCPECGALVRADQQWCTLCLHVLHEPEPEPAARSPSRSRCPQPGAGDARCRRPSCAAAAEVPSRTPRPAADPHARGRGRGRGPAGAAGRRDPPGGSARCRRTCSPRASGRSPSSS